MSRRHLCLNAACFSQQDRGHLVLDGQRELRPRDGGVAILHAAGGLRQTSGHLVDGRQLGLRARIASAAAGAYHQAPGARLINFESN